MSSSLQLVNQIQSSLEKVTGFQNDLQPTDFLVPSVENNALIVKDGADAAEVMICLQEKLLQRFEKTRLPGDFSLDLYPDLSIVIEELSHFNTFCESAIADRKISPIELEVQAEVDKFSVALDWLHGQNQNELIHRAYDILFENIKLGRWVSSDDQSRYIEAHRIAKNFCRKVLENTPEHSNRLKNFKEFFHLSKEEKLGIRF